MTRVMGESCYEDWDQVVQLACVSSPGSPGSSLHEAHAWLEVYFDLSFFSEKDQWIQLEILRRKIAALYSWMWGDDPDGLLVRFDIETAADRALQLYGAALLGDMGRIGHLPPLPRTDIATAKDDDPETRKWLKDYCARVTKRACTYRDRMLYRNYEVTAYHDNGRSTFPFFAEAGLYATAVDADALIGQVPVEHGAIANPLEDDDERLEQGFQTFLAMLADEGFPTSAYRLSVGLFREAESTFREAVEWHVSVSLSRNDEG